MGLQTLWVDVYYYVHFMDKKTGTEKLGILAKVTELRSGRVRVWTQELARTDS